MEKYLEYAVEVKYLEAAIEAICDRIKAESKKKNVDEEVEGARKLGAAIINVAVKTKKIFENAKK